MNLVFKRLSTVYLLIAIFVLGYSATCQSQSEEKLTSAKNSMIVKFDDNPSAQLLESDEIKRMYLLETQEQYLQEYQAGDEADFAIFLMIIGALATIGLLAPG